MTIRGAEMVGRSLPGEVASRHRATNRSVLAIGDLTGAVAKAMMNRMVMKGGALPSRAAGVSPSSITSTFVQSTSTGLSEK
jgi:hypothetical protein